MEINQKKSGKKKVVYSKPKFKVQQLYGRLGKRGLSISEESLFLAAAEYLDEY